MKYILNGTCSKFNEEANSVDANHVCKEFSYSALSIPYIFQMLTGILVFIVINACIVITAIFIDIQALCILLINLIVGPLIGAFTVRWMEYTWEQKNKELMDKTLREWDDKSLQELTRAEEWRKNHPLEEKCRVAFERQNINPVAVASILKELIPKKE